jgi:hypothetical protein
MKAQYLTRAELPIRQTEPRRAAIGEGVSLGDSLSRKPNQFFQFPNVIGQSRRHLLAVPRIFSRFTFLRTRSFP